MVCRGLRGQLRTSGRTCGAFGATIVLPGRNYGWPVVGYGVNYETGTAIHGGTLRAGMENPLHVWVPSIGASGLMLYNGDRFPQWRGSSFAGGLSGEQIARLTMDGQKVVLEETLLHRMGRVRDVRQGPDGYIYVASDGNERDDKTPIYRLEPADESQTSDSTGRQKELGLESALAPR